MKHNISECPDCICPTCKHLMDDGNCTEDFLERGWACDNCDFLRIKEPYDKCGFYKRKEADHEA
jgi:hypothetical protein